MISYFLSFVNAIFLCYRKNKGVSCWAAIDFIEGMCVLYLPGTHDVLREVEVWD